MRAISLSTSIKRAERSRLEMNLENMSVEHKNKMITIAHNNTILSKQVKSLFKLTDFRKGTMSILP